MPDSGKDDSVLGDVTNHDARSFDIAVITPTHNRATLICDALDSIIAQSFQGRIEVAVVDDGSTDDTEVVMQPYLKEYGDETGRLVIRYSKLDKQGVVVARNTAIAQTTAPLIALLDSDDYWEADKLQKQIDVLNGDDSIGVVHTSFRYVNEQNEFTDDGPQRLSNPCVGDCLDIMLDEFLVLFSSVMVRRSIVDKAAAAEQHGHPFDKRWTNSQDYDLMLRCARHCTFGYVAEPLTLYRVHGAHGAMGNLKRAFGFHCRVQMDFVKRYGDQIGIGEAEIKKRVVNFVAGRAESMFWQRDFDKARDLCELARELDVYNDRFAAIEAKASRPAWLYKAKDAVDRVLGRNG
jgi:glycosyltransferase involved in cell wall biosynthesis